MTNTEITIRPAILPVDRAPLLAIIEEYLDWLAMDLSYRGLDAEMAAFDARFSLPSGMFFIAEVDGNIAGCAGFLRHPGNRAEMKRLFVRPAYRGLAMGERLVQSVIDATAALGFTRLILDAVPQTGFAMRLYERMGFCEGPPFYSNAVPGTRFFTMALGKGC